MYKFKLVQTLNVQPSPGMDLRTSTTTANLNINDSYRLSSSAFYGCRPGKAFSGKWLQMTSEWKHLGAKEWKSNGSKLCPSCAGPGPSARPQFRTRKGQMGAGPEIRWAISGKQNATLQATMPLGKWAAWSAMCFFKFRGESTKKTCQSMTTMPLHCALLR
jgi:hypothetical protein